MAPGNTTNIVKQLLFDPISTGADRLCIISYQATPSMASWLLKTFEEYGISDITVELIIGSTIKEGIDNISHDGFKELQGDRYSKIYKNFTCSYLYQGSIPKTNLFIWLKDNVPICAYSGSYEFTQASLLRKCDNTLISCEPVDAYKNTKPLLTVPYSAIMQKWKISLSSGCNQIHPFYFNRISMITLYIFRF